MGPLAPPPSFPILVAVKLLFNVVIALPCFIENLEEHVEHHTLEYIQRKN